MLNILLSDTNYYNLCVKNYLSDRYYMYMQSRRIKYIILFLSNKKNELKNIYTYSFQFLLKYKKSW